MPYLQEMWIRKPGTFASYRVPGREEKPLIYHRRMYPTAAVRVGYKQPAHDALVTRPGVGVAVEPQGLAFGQHSQQRAVGAGERRLGPHVSVVRVDRLDAQAGNNHPAHALDPL